MKKFQNLFSCPENTENERDGKLFYKSNCISPFAKAEKARREHALKGDLAYVDEEAYPDQENGWVEDTHTVWHKVKSKEEFPQG